MVIPNEEYVQANIGQGRGSEFALDDAPLSVPARPIVLGTKKFGLLPFEWFAVITTLATSAIFIVGIGVCVVAPAYRSKAPVSSKKIQPVINEKENLAAEP